MGHFDMFHCDHCGYEDSIQYGIGMLFPQEYEKVMSAIKDGQYGDDMRDAAAETPGIAVDAGMHLYVCPACGTWMNDYGLTLYEPNQPDQQERPYVMLYELRSDYHVRKRYLHKCPTCRKVMHRFVEGDKVVCPQCHRPGRIEAGGMWD